MEGAGDKMMPLASRAGVHETVDVPVSIMKPRKPISAKQRSGGWEEDDGGRRPLL